MDDEQKALFGLPNVMLDAVTIGLCGWVESEKDISPSDLRKRFERLKPWAEVTTPKSKLANPNYLQVTILLTNETGVNLGTAKLDLFFSKANRGLRLTSRSSLTLNPQRGIRAELGGEAACGPVGLDGNDNLLGSGRELSPLLDQAIDLVQAVFEHALDLCDRAIPKGAHWRWERFWLKSAEACRDIPVQDAIGAVRRSQQAAIAGSVGTVLRGYEPRVEEGKRVTALTWLSGKNRPEYKVYPKREDLLRLEFVCRDRKAVVWFVGGSMDSTAVSGVARFFEIFAATAAVEVDRLESHVRSALTGTPDVTGLLVGLAPLTSMAAGINTGRGPAPQDVSIRAANDALGGIMMVGQYDASHLPCGHAIRTVLKKLCGHGGPLLKRMGRSVYCLNPALAASAATVVGMVASRDSEAEEMREG